MQKNNKKASILLWAVMLSLIIAILFISISTKINKNIKTSGDLKNFIEEKNKIEIAKTSLTDTGISENKAIIFQNNKEKIFSLKNKENMNLSFSGTSDFNIDIGIINGSEINYFYENAGNITSSGIISYSESFTGKLDSTNNTGSLVLKNLGGYSKFKINSENSFETGKKSYKIVTKIGNNFFNETKNEY